MSSRLSVVNVRLLSFPCNGKFFSSENVMVPGNSNKKEGEEEKRQRKREEGRWEREEDEEGGGRRGLCMNF